MDALRLEVEREIERDVLDGEGAWPFEVTRARRERERPRCRGAAMLMGVCVRVTFVTKAGAARVKSMLDAHWEGGQDTTTSATIR